MAGLDPAIHVFLRCGKEDVDARHKAGHDDGVCRYETMQFARKAIEHARN
jgi:hypothetical protein